MQLSHATSNIYSPLRVFAGRIGGQTRRSGRAAGRSTGRKAPGL